MRIARPTTLLVTVTGFLAAMAFATLASGQLGVGTTWVRTDAEGRGMTMSVEACCSGGLRLIYHIAIPNQPAVTLTVDSPMNGTEVPAFVAGKPSGETMAIKRVDDHHYTGVVKMNGEVLATSNATVSPDDKSITVENVTQGQKVVETWIRK